MISPYLLRPIRTLDQVLGAAAARALRESTPPFRPSAKPVERAFAAPTSTDFQDSEAAKRDA